MKPSSERSACTRREFLTHAAATSGAIAACSNVTSASPGNSDNGSKKENLGGVVDVHHHVLPDAYRKSMPFPQKEWQLERALEAMDRLGIDKALASVSPLPTDAPPGVALEWSRPINEFLADLVRKTQRRYGAFGVLPLRDVDEALKEAAYVIDELGLDGFILPASVDGEYLGQPSFDPILDYLHQRKSVVFVHPGSVPGSDAVKTAMPPPTLDYLFDTTRAIGNLLFTGTFDRCRDISFIFAHAGGTAPYAAGRMALLADSHLQPGKERMQRGVIETMQSLYFDLALSAFPYSLGGLTELVAPTQLLFGSDCFRAPEEVAEKTLRGIRTFQGFDASAVREVERSCALRLFPHLKNT